MPAEVSVFSDSTILATTATLVAGLGGYLAREWQMRARPFPAILAIEGDFRRGSTVVTVPSEVTDALGRARWVTRLGPQATLDQVHKTWGEARELAEAGPALEAALAAAVEVCRAGDRSTLQRILARLLANRLAERLILYLIATDTVTAPECGEDETVVPVWSSHEHEGSVWIGFPEDSVNFGGRFDSNPLIRERCGRFVALIQRMDCDGLARVCDGLRSVLQGETVLANRVPAPLRRLLDENSFWEIRLYLANMGRHPLLVQRRARLLVTDRTGARFDEPCELVRVVRDDEGEIRARRVALGPLVLPAGEIAEFSFFTERPQREMENGQAFRVAFESGGAICRVVYDVETVGLFRRRTLSTPAVPFRNAA